MGSSRVGNTLQPHVWEVIGAHILPSQCEVCFVTYRQVAPKSTSCHHTGAVEGAQGVGCPTLVRMQQLCGLVHCVYACTGAVQLVAGKVVVAVCVGLLVVIANYACRALGPCVCG